MIEIVGKGETTRPEVTAASTIAIQKRGILQKSF
jgi:hypothetical protein